MLNIIVIASDNHVYCIMLILIHFILGVVPTTAAPTTPTIEPTTEKGINNFNNMLSNFPFVSYDLYSGILFYLTFNQSILEPAIVLRGETNGEFVTNQPFVTTEANHASKMALQPFSVLGFLVLLKLMF